MSATREQAEFVFTEWHRLVSARDGSGLSALYTDDAELESPLVPRVLDDAPDGIVRGREPLDAFLRLVTASRPEHDQLPSLYRTGTYAFDGHTLMWEYPRRTPRGDQLDLVEVMELDGARIRRHRIYWGWRGTEHVITNAVTKAVAEGNPSRPGTGAE
jgi:steroid Delta-isomerase